MYNSRSAGLVFNDLVLEVRKVTSRGPVDFPERINKVKTAWVTLWLLFFN